MSPLTTLAEPPPPPRPPLLVRLFTAPLSPGAIERRFQRTVIPHALRLWWVPMLLGVLGLAYAAWGWWVTRPPLLSPRHRAEALCFALAQPPAFAPPMGIEPSAALAHGPFPPGTPPAFALERVMGFDDAMVMRRSRRHVGDYDVAVLWLRVPAGGGPQHRLVAGWLEGSDLAVASFRFAHPGAVLSEDEQAWGERLLARVLVPANFRAGALPDVRLRAVDGRTMPRFGPEG